MANDSSTFDCRGNRLSVRLIYDRVLLCKACPRRYPKYGQREYRDDEYVSHRYPDGIKILEAYAGLGAVLGHNFPVHLKFKGGKGIATTAGMMLAFCPWAVPVCLVLFTLSIFVKKYVSVGSLLVCIGFFVQTVIFGKNGMLGAPPQALTEIFAVVGAVCVLGLIRHQSNIKRLLSGTENKVFVHEENQ